eukprot:14654676-Heterocapsa_arctica.AAC.1
MTYMNIRANRVLEPHQGPIELAAKFGLGITSAYHGDLVNKCIAFITKEAASLRIEQLQSTAVWDLLSPLCASRLETISKSHNPRSGANRT